MRGRGPRSAGWTRRGKELGRAVAGPTRGVSRPSVRSRPSRRRRARPTTIRARVERPAATQAHGGRLGLPLQGLRLPHCSGRFPQTAVTWPGPPRSACRRSGRQAQGRRPALNHHRLRFGAAAGVGLGNGFHGADAQARLDNPMSDTHGIRDREQRARACPAVIRPSTTKSLTSGGRSRRRIMLVTWGRLLPGIWARSA